ncbi:MAG: FtsB family cell division protein [Desulfatibacillaceae bacterium]
MTFWDKVFMTALVACICVAAYTAVLGDRGILELRRLEAARVETQARNDDIAGENERLMRTIQRLKHDSAYVEQVAREEYGMVGKGEVIYQFDDRSRFGDR